MKYHAPLILISVVVLAALFAGCTTPPQSVPPTTTITTQATSTPVATTVQSQSTLTGTWTLTSVLGGKGVTSVLPGITVTATFADDGTVSGSAGCNNYVALYQALRNTIAIGTPATTDKSCTSPAGIMTQETLFLTNLQGAATYAINGDVLTISDDTGKVLLNFQKGGSPATSFSLAEIPWTLTSYKGSAGSMEQVIPATNLTALFGPDRKITGSAGCNSFTGGYVHVAQNNITIGPLAMTLMYCGDPGVMDQETAYLANLQAASTYEVTGDGMLELKDAAGIPVLVFSS